MNKPLSAKLMLLIAVASFSFGYFVGGVIGLAFNFFGTICLALGIVRLVGEIHSKNKETNNRK